MELGLGLPYTLRRLSVKPSSSFLGCHGLGLVATYADPGKGHTSGAGGEGPPGPRPHGLREDRSLCYSDAAVASPQEGGG